MSTQAELLFNLVENSFNKLLSLSWDGEEDLLCFEAAMFCARKDYDNALKALREYVKSKELQAQAGGVM